jgi:ankyrin repeat protein
MTSYAFLGYEFGGTALRAATNCGDFDLVRTLLDSGAPTDGDTEWGTALQIAANHRDIDIFELLISYGADINTPASGQEKTDLLATALQAAVRNGHIRFVQLLLHRCADVNAQRGAALAAAARRGDFELLQPLMEHGADMEKHGASVVIEAVGNVSLESLRYLLDAWTLASDGNLERGRNGHAKTALEISTRADDIGLTRLLLEYEAGNISLALRVAARPSSTNMELVELLLASGAEIGHLVDDSGNDYKDMTALDNAASGAHLDILRLFLENRTGLTADEKSRALQVAVDCGKLDAARLLLDHGADVNAAPVAYLDGTRKTALQAAASNSNLKMVQFLLEADAHVESKTSPGNEQALAFPEEATALQFAAIAGSMSIVTLLIEKGANVFAPAMGDDGRTALEGAAEHGRLDIVQLLLNLGAEVAGSRAIQFAREEGHDGAGVVALLEEA